MVYIIDSRACEGLGKEVGVILPTQLFFDVFFSLLKYFSRPQVILTSQIVIELYFIISKNQPEHVSSLSWLR